MAVAQRRQLARQQHLGRDQRAVVVEPEAEAEIVEPEDEAEIVAPEAEAEADAEAEAPPEA